MALEFFGNGEAEVIAIGVEFAVKHIPFRIVCKSTAGVIEEVYLVVDEYYTEQCQLALEDHERFKELNKSRSDKKVM